MNASTSVSHDPLKTVLARAIPARHFYLPAPTRLRERFTAGRELAADRAALASHGTAPLAGALFKATEGLPKARPGQSPPRSPP
jgi:hypothetical protein